MIRRRGTAALITIAALALSLTLTVTTAKGTPPPNVSPLVAVSLSLSKTTVEIGESIVISAHATSRSSGADVPASRGEIEIQWCFAPSSLSDTLPAASCDGPNATGNWLGVQAGAPPLFNWSLDTTGFPAGTIGVRALYRPKGSGYAGAHSASLDLVVTRKYVLLSVDATPNPVLVGQTVEFLALAADTKLVDVPASAGEIEIQWCFAPSSISDTLPAAGCDGPNATGTWLGVQSGAPPVLDWSLDTTGFPERTTGVRAVFIPSAGSEYATRTSDTLDLVVTRVHVTVTPPSVTLSPGGHTQFVATVTGTTNPLVNWSAAGGTISPTGLYTAGTSPGTYTVTATSADNANGQGTATVTIAPANCDPGGIYTGAIHDSANSYSDPLTIAVWHMSCEPPYQTFISYFCTAFPCQEITLLIFLDPNTMTFTGTIPATVCSAPGVCPTLISGDFTNGVIHFQYEPGQDEFFDGTYVNGG